MKTLLFVITLVISLTAAAQTDFSGTWKLDKAKSKLNEQFSMAPKEMIIVQGGIDFSVEKHIDFQEQVITSKDKYTLDGKECVNRGFMDTQKKSTVTCSDDKKSLKINTKVPFNGEEMTVTEEFRLEEGNLVLVSSAKSSRGELTETYVFIRN